MAMKSFRVIAWIEAISYLVLLLVAMPLKYLAGVPMAVRIAGGLHGFLFVAFCVALFVVASEKRWPWMKSAKVFVSSLIPGGIVWLEREIRR
jgi:integral membrane protein